MINKKEIIQQTTLAFDFIQKLYLEVSYLVKEIEGLLAEDVEDFIIGRGSGYSITTKSSSGLESSYVNLWLMRTFSVFFVPQDMTERKAGTTITAINPELKTILVKVVLDEDKIAEPYILVGTIFDIHNKSEKYARNAKFETLLPHVEARWNKLFSKDESFDYEDGYYKFKCKLFRVNLFDVNTSEEILRLIVNPALELYRSL